MCRQALFCLTFLLLACQEVSSGPYFLTTVFKAREGDQSDSSAFLFVFTVRSESKPPEGVRKLQLNIPPTPTTMAKKYINHWGSNGCLFVLKRIKNRWGHKTTAEYPSDKGQKSRSRGSVGCLFGFSVQRKDQITGGTIKLPQKMPTAPTKPLRVVCVWAPRCLRVRPFNLSRPHSSATSS